MKLKDQAAETSGLARRLAHDKKFRKRLVSAIEHGAEARRRAAARVVGTASDKDVRAELRHARADLEHAYRRLLAKKRRHRLRKALLVAGLAAVALLPQVRQRITALFSGDAGLDDLTRDELYARAQDADIPGRSEMTKQQLVEALRAQD